MSVCIYTYFDSVFVGGFVESYFTDPAAELLQGVSGESGEYDRTR